MPQIGWKSKKKKFQHLKNFLKMRKSAEKRNSHTPEWLDENVNFSVLRICLIWIHVNFDFANHFCRYKFDFHRNAYSTTISLHLIMGDSLVHFYPGMCCACCSYRSYQRERWQGIRNRIFCSIGKWQNWNISLEIITTTTKTYYVQTWHKDRDVPLPMGHF